MIFSIDLYGLISNIDLYGLISSINLYGLISSIDLDGLIADLEAEVVVGGVPDAWENVEDVRELDKLTELGEDPGLEIGEN